MREFLRGVVLALICAWAVGADAGKPNIVLVITDDQGYGDLGAHGNTFVRTPNLDRLHDTSTRIEPFYVSPVCAPTRASLMTGRYNYRTGVVDTYIGRAMMHTSEVTLPEILKSAGYRTGLFGKWHLGDNYPLRPQDQGFDEVLMHRGGGIGQPSDPPKNHYSDPKLQHNGVEEQYSGYCTDIFFDAAMKWMEEGEDPFFAYIATNAPHTPLEVPESYVAPYRAKGLPESTAKLYGMVENIDDNMGKLIDFLEKHNLSENTILLFMTDNGPQFAHKEARFNADLRGTKGTVYEGGIRVPCFVRWPGMLSGGKAVTTPGAHIDLLPTLADFAEIALPKDLNLDGVSLAPLLRGEVETMSERPLAFQWHRGDEPEAFRDAAIRVGDYKLVRGEELYNLAEDPAEAHDIAANNPEKLAELRATYETWFKGVSDTRGYAPPRIVIDPEHEPIAVLTPQDWRGSEGWPSSRSGYWELDIATPGDYTVTLDFVDPVAAIPATVEMGPLRVTETLAEGETTHTFTLSGLQRGPTRLRFDLPDAEKEHGVRYAYVKRTD